jgi:uncharacterized protein YehS (DUF1456 family)
MQPSKKRKKKKEKSPSLEVEKNKRNNMWIVLARSALSFA